MGAWIETRQLPGQVNRSQVALLVGAWIETIEHDLCSPDRNCRPPRGGVDRNLTGSRKDALALVALLVGAWIETGEILWATYAPARRPPRGGVDRNKETCWPTAKKMSRPPRGGVDRNKGFVSSILGSFVALLVGAWIETSQNASASASFLSPSSWGRGSKPIHPHDILKGTKSPSSWGVDRNKTYRADLAKAGSRPPRGGVDRNLPWTV